MTVTNWGIDRCDEVIVISESFNIRYSKFKLRDIPAHIWFKRTRLSSGKVSESKVSTSDMARMIDTYINLGYVVLPVAHSTECSDVECI